MDAKKRENDLIELIIKEEAKSPKVRPSPEFLERLNARLDARQPRRSLSLWYAAAAVLLIVCAGVFLLPSIFERNADFTRIAGLVGGVQVDGSALAIGSHLKEGSRIETAPDGYALIDFGGVATLLLEPQTKITVTRIASGHIPTIQLHQDMGSTFSEIVPGKAAYQIKSGANVFRVLGTAFALETDSPGAARLKVTHGTVAAGNNLRVQKSEGTNCVQSVCAAAQALSVESRTRLIALSQILNQSGLASLAAADQHRQWSIAELKEKYGKLSIVETITGKKYTGGFRTHKERLIIQTRTEKIELDTRLVKKIIPVTNAK